MLDPIDTGEMWPNVGGFAFITEHAPDIQGVNGLKGFRNPVKVLRRSKKTKE
jgi:hypothetical protein